MRHISFFNTKSISRLAESVGLKLAHTFYLRYMEIAPSVLCHQNARPMNSLLRAFDDTEFRIDEDLVNYESSIGLFHWQTYDKFRVRVKEILLELREEVVHRRLQGFGIVFVGRQPRL